MWLHNFAFTDIEIFCDGENIINYYVNYMRYFDTYPNVWSSGQLVQLIMGHQKVTFSGIPLQTWP